MHDSVVDVHKSQGQICGLYKQETALFERMCENKTQLIEGRVFFE